MIGQADVGRRVRVLTAGGGYFYGTVVRIHRIGGIPVRADILPESIEVMHFLGADGTYDLGVSHWGSATVVEP